MHKIKDVLRLKQDAKLSHQQIADARCLSKGVAIKYVGLAAAAGLNWSAVQAEIVRNHTLETWLACHRHAFEWFNGVTKKVRIDNLKAAITKACCYEPAVQRSYEELARGSALLIDPFPAGSLRSYLRNRDL